ncbi:MAG: nucleotidyltransferase domain-containing protein [Defluviitaleaceae bacterium]|nr:nucleotidyltransferase domain-containing protein [Defluviitaleaceae bacterium]MCL2261620.1 nucleotidyltransferase domain-containing protein [Defluviitaleaceae bacterium]
MPCKKINWEEVRIRKPVRHVLERVANGNHNPNIRYIILFGSEARGEAVLTSDVDIALVSDEPLTTAERLQFTEIFEGDNYPEYRVINTSIEDLNTDKFMDVNYHIKRDGLIIYER